MCSYMHIHTRMYAYTCMYMRGEHLGIYHLIFKSLSPYPHLYLYLYLYIYVYICERHYIYAGMNFDEFSDLQIEKQTRTARGQHMDINPHTQYNTLQHTATHCNILQYAATHCIARTATQCNMLQHTATHCNTPHHTEKHCSTLQHTATHCNTLRHTATHCDTLRHTATHCDTHCNTPRAALSHKATNPPTQAYPRTCLSGGLRPTKKGKTHLQRENSTVT